MAELKDREGTHFLMKGGPYDGLYLRLFRQPPAGSKVSGWDVLEVEGGVYFRPSDVDPYVQRGAMNKKRTNLPYMEWSPT